MRKDHKKCGRFLAAALCGAVLTGMAPGLVVQAAPEMAMQLRTKGIEDPVVTAKSWEGDYVVYSDCYAWQDSTQTAEIGRAHV